MPDSDYLLDAAQERWPHILMTYQRFEAKKPVMLLDIQEQQIYAYPYADFSSDLSEKSQHSLKEQYEKALRENKFVDRQRIFTADAYSEDRFHYGGRMAFLNGYLVLTVGERHHQDRAQELTNDAGKILRLRDDGTVPPDNQIGRASCRERV